MNLFGIRKCAYCLSPLKIAVFAVLPELANIITAKGVINSFLYGRQPFRHMRRHFQPFQWYDYAFCSCSPRATWPLQGVNSQTQAGNNGTSGFLRYTQDFCGTHRISAVPGTAVTLNYRYLRNTRYYPGTLPWSQAVLAKFSSRVFLCLIGIQYIESSVLITRSTYCVLNLASRTGLSRSTKLSRSRSDVINLVHVDLLYLQLQVPSLKGCRYRVEQPGSTTFTSSTRVDRIVIQSKRLINLVPSSIYQYLQDPSTKFYYLWTQKSCCGCTTVAGLGLQ